MIPLWLFSLPLDEINTAAGKHGLEAQLVAAIVMVESGGRAWATRYEPGFRYLHNPAAWASSLGITHESEVQLQMTSFGLMQVMGGTARDCGFRGYLPEIARAEIGLDLGCKYLKRLAQRYETMEEIVAAYNAGSVRKTPGGMFENQGYVDKVFGYYRELIQIN